MSYGYDALYRLTSETRTGAGAYTENFDYDLAGNLVTFNGSSFATYDSANKISSLTGGAVSYDADGNMTSVNGTTLTWDMRNRLRRQQTATEDLTYKYDFTGKRVMRHPTGAPASKTFYIFLGDTLIMEISCRR